MTGPHQLSRRDWLVAAALMAVAVLLRVPVRAASAYNLDGVGFVQAVSEYNLALFQPHAPGYFLYIMAARLVNVVVHDPHASLVWLSVLASSGVAVLISLLATRMFGRPAGWAAGLMAVTSPALWFHGAVGLVYAVDAFLICLTIWWCCRAIERGGTWSDAVGLGLLLAVVAGVRGQTAPQLVPLIGFCCWKFRLPRASKVLAVAAVAGAGVAAWFFPMLAQGGGWPVYAELLRRNAAFNAPFTLAGGGVNALGWSLFFAGAHLWAGLVLAVVVLGVALVYRVMGMDPARRAAWNREHRLALAVLGWWVVPMVAFGMLLAFTLLPGYVLGYLPALLVLAGAAVGGLPRPAVRAGVSLAVVAANIAVFTAWPAAWDGAFFRVGLTARTIRSHDELVHRTVAQLRAECSPTETVVLHAFGNVSLSLRHLQLAAPEFEQYQLVIDRAMPAPADRPLLGVRDGRLEYVAAAATQGKRWAVFVVPPGRTLHDYDGRFDWSGAIPIGPQPAVLYRKRLP